MPRITIDEIDFNSEDLSEDGQRVFKSIKFSDAEIKRIKADLAILRVAQAQYEQALEIELENYKT